MVDFGYKILQLKAKCFSKNDCRYCTCAFGRRYGTFHYCTLHYNDELELLNYQQTSRTVYPKKYAHDFCFAVLCCGYTLTDIVSHRHGWLLECLLPVFWGIIIACACVSSIHLIHLPTKKVCSLICHISDVIGGVQVIRVYKLLKQDVDQQFGSSGL